MMYGLKCPECNAPLEGDGGSCAACGWPKGGPEPEPAPLEADEPGPASPKKRKKKRPAERSERPEGRSTPLPVFAIGMGVLLLGWAALAGMAFAGRNTGLALIVLGMGTVLAGGAWVVIAAYNDGVTIWSFTSGNGIVMAALAVIQIAALPFLSVYHMTVHFEGAWRPAAVLLVGVGMAVCGFLFLR
jgi:hypothetical protein